LLHVKTFCVAASGSQLESRRMAGGISSTPISRPAAWLSA